MKSSLQIKILLALVVAALGAFAFQFKKVDGGEVIKTETVLAPVKSVETYPSIVKE